MLQLQELCKVNPYGEGIIFVGWPHQAQIIASSSRSGGNNQEWISYEK